LAGRTCNTSGCGLHGPGLHIDHLAPWASAGGHTNPTNGANNCHWHNHAKDRLHITVTRDHTGWHYHRPDGTEIAPRPKPRRTSSG